MNRRWPNTPKPLGNHWATKPNHSHSYSHSLFCFCLRNERHQLYILYIFFFFLGVHSKRQQVIYSLIILLRQEGLGFRRISRKLNQWGIKTHRGKQWFNTSVSSVLKRKHERDVLFDDIRNQHYPTKISKMELKYYTFDWLV